MILKLSLFMKTIMELDMYLIIIRVEVEKDMNNIVFKSMKIKQPLIFIKRFEYYIYFAFRC